MNVLDEVAAEAPRMAEAQTQPERRDAEVDMEIDSSTKVAGHCAERQAVTACLLHLFTISHFSSTSCAKNSSLISCTTTMAKRMQEQKRTRKKCGKIEIYSDEPVFSCSDKVSSAKKYDCIQRSGDTHSYGETCEQDERKHSKSDAASSSQARLKDAYLGGLMDTATGKLVVTKEESGYVDFSGSETWIFPEEAVMVKPIACKKATVKPNASSKSDCQGGPKAERKDWSHNLHMSPRVLARVLLCLV